MHTEEEQGEVVESEGSQSSPGTSMHTEEEEDEMSKSEGSQSSPETSMYTEEQDERLESEGSQSSPESSSGSSSGRSRPESVISEMPMDEDIEKEDEESQRESVKPKRKTHSIQHFSSERDEIEPKGPYMKAIEREVEDLAKSIQGSGNKHRATESEREMLTDIESENEIIADTDSDVEIINEIARQVKRKLTDRDVFGSSSSEGEKEESQPKKNEEESQPKKKEVMKPKKKIQLKLTAWKRKAERKKLEVSKLKKFTTKTPQGKFSGWTKKAKPVMQKKVRRDSENDPDYNPEENLAEESEEDSIISETFKSTQENDSDFDGNSDKSEDESTRNEQVKSRGVKRKAAEVESSDDDEFDVEVAVGEKKPVKNPGCYKRRKIQCPVCDKPLAKSSSVLRAHYASFHPLIPDDRRDEKIAIVTQRAPPKRKDCASDSDKVDKRNRRKTCVYCSKDFSESHLRADHLKPDSKLKCGLIPTDELDNLDTVDEKKKWTAAAIARCERPLLTAPKEYKVYAGESYFTVDELLHACYKQNISYQGKLYIPPSIKEKMRRKQNLTPEERKLSYRPMAVRHQQKRVMHHIFGDKQFQLKDIDQVCNWMKTEEAEEEFFNSRLIAVSKELGRTPKLSHSTIASLARSMLELLKYIQTEYRDMEVKEAAARAIDAVKKVERTACRMNTAATKRRIYLEKENYLIPLADLKKFLESKEHREVMNKAMYIYMTEDYEERVERAKELYKRKQVYELQCHLAARLTMHTGKRPGVLCGIKIEDVNSKGENVKEFRAQWDPDELSYQFKVVPSCEYAVFKTVSVAHVNVSGGMLSLLETLGFLRLAIDKAVRDQRLFTSYTMIPLLDIDVLMKKAWSDAGLKSNFNSTKIRHTIVTAGRDPENKLNVEELKALARGMDHSVETAESRYYHEQEKRMVDHSKIIERVLKLNGIKSWNYEIKTGIEEGIENDVMTGEYELLEGEEEDEDTTTQNEEDESGTTKRIVGRNPVVFNEKQTDLVKRLFEEYIDDKVENPKKAVSQKDIRGIVIQFIYLLC